MIPGDTKERLNANKICEIHNEQYGEIEFDNYVCIKCHLQDKIRIGKENQLSYEMDVANNVLSLPARLQKYSFENYKSTDDSKQIFEDCKEYVENWPNVGGLLMLGGVGTGKTHLAVSICKELRDKAICCKLTTVNRIIRDVRSSWGKRSERSEEEVISEYVDHHLLVIDEIGSQYGSESERIIINEIINDRYEMDRPTVLIGNVSISEAGKILGTRVVDRIKDNGRLLFFEWESYRKVRQ